MQTITSIQTLIGACSYKPGWYFLVKEEADRVYLQVGVTEEAEISMSPFTGQREPWKGAKHYLSYHMCDSEVVGALFGAIQQAENHESREWFRFTGRSIYNPHMSVWKLAEFAKLKNFDLRENAMSMEESQ